MCIYVLPIGNIRHHSIHFHKFATVLCKSLHDTPLPVIESFNSIPFSFLVSLRYKQKIQETSALKLQ